MMKMYVTLITLLITIILETTQIDTHHLIELLIVEPRFYLILEKNRIRISSSLAKCTRHLHVRSNS